MKVSSLTSQIALSVSLSVASVAGIIVLGTGSAFGDAGGGHSHDPASKEQVLEKSKKTRDTLIKEGKIDAAWKDLAAENAEQKTFKSGKKEWVVTFKDPKATDKAKETLYIFYSLTGNYLASNFTGQ